jgi:Ca2+-binding EF-hand superfamily protein
MKGAQMRFRNTTGRSVAVLSIVAICVWAGSVSAASKSRRGSSTTKPAPKLCLGAVDPFDRSTQKTGFFAIAGKDGELTSEEFRDASENTKIISTKAFLRSFDTFASLSRFDKDKNSKIDWVEAQAYRVDLRKRVLAAFDANKDSRLKGPERDAANRALAAGKFTRGGMQSRRDAFLKKYDKDGDGELSDEERKAMGESFRKRSMEQYDKDGDGKLSEEERRAMRRGRGGAWREATERWRLQHFDLDADGKLNEAEEAAQREFQGQFRDMGKKLDVKFNDLNGDGEVTREERQKIMREWAKSALSMMALASTYMDRDGDGTVSADERNGFGKRIQTGMIKWMEDFGNEFDADTNGRLDKAERTAFVAGIQKNIVSRVDRFDADKDGRLSPPETIEMLKGFAKELDIGPSEAKLKAIEEIAPKKPDKKPRDR